MYNMYNVTVYILLKQDLTIALWNIAEVLNLNLSQSWDFELIF